MDITTSNEIMKDIVVVTGASRGIGRATAILLAENGYHVIAVARNKKMLEEIESHNIEIYVVDITQDDQVYHFCQKLIGRNVVALINNAGGKVGFSDNILEDDIENWSKTFDLNVTAVANITKQIVPIIENSGGGNVVVVTAIQGHFAYKGGSIYNIAKHAEVALTEILRSQLGNKNIRVTEIVPGRTYNHHYKDEAKDVLSPEDVAESIRWSIMAPKHVNIEKIYLSHVNPIRK
jgi:NADP-dependent 3-hydroxy acid dehydrogenase YdfG